MCVSNIWDTSRKRDIYVQFDPIKLRQYHLSTTEIRQKLLEYLTYSPVGQITSNEDTFSVELSKFNENLESLRRFPVAMNSTGQNLTLGQVADVDFKLEKQTRLDLVNGEESVLIWLRKGMEADTIDIKDKVEKVINDFNDELKNRSETSALKINILYDGPHFIQQQLDVLKKNGIVGLILVLCVLILFLNSRIALMTALGIPVAYFGAFAVLSVLGISIDLISIIGLILVLGMLVDDAIIVSERYSENLEKGLTPKDAAFQAAKSLMVPVTGTVLTTAVAFAPILFLSSEMAIVLFAVPIVIISTLTFSWFESFFILPNHLYHFVKRPPNPKATYYFNKINFQKTNYRNSTFINRRICIF